MTYHSYHKTNLNPLNLQFRQKTKNFYTESWSPAEIWTTGSTDRHDANLLKFFHATFRRFCRTCEKRRPDDREDFKRSKWLFVLPRFELGIFMHWTCNSMNNLSSYCELVDAKIRAFDKDLPVTKYHFSLAQLIF